MKAAWRALPQGGFAADSKRPGVDAMLVWADATGFADFLRPDQGVPQDVPVLCELKTPGEVLLLASELGKWGGDVPRIYIDASGGKSLFCTAIFSKTFCKAWAKGKAGRMIRRFELQLPVIPRRPAPAVSPAELPLGQRRPVCQAEVLLGVIDSGCPFAHGQLRREHKTRLLALWDQNTAPAFAEIGGRRPHDLGYGGEMRRESLNQVIKRHRRQGAIDEEGCYRAAGLMNLRRLASHGASVLDLFAGFTPLSSRLWATPDTPPSWATQPDEASRADIAFVDLPHDAVQDSSSGSLGRCLLDGLRYIVSCAGKRTHRVVVNVSNGTSRSTHDGKSIIELAMVELIEQQHQQGRELHVVISAGNEHDEERHAQVDSLKAGTSASVKVRVPPDSESPTWISVRVPEGAKRLRIGLTAPGDSSPPRLVSAGQAFGRYASAATPDAGVIYPVPLPGAAGLALLVIAPTALEQSGGGCCAPHGDWKIWLQSDVDLGTPLHLYISRNQRNAGMLQRSRQARFVENYNGYDPQRWRREATADPEQPSSPIRRAATLNGLATVGTGKGVLVVGSVQQREGVYSRYSSSGPAAGPDGDPSRLGPDVAAVADLHHNLRGIVAAGSLSGHRVRVTGTSYAAPQAARYVANHGVPPRDSADADPVREARGAPLPQLFEHVGY